MYRKFFMLAGSPGYCDIRVQDKDHNYIFFDDLEQIGISSKKVCDELGRIINTLGKTNTITLSEEKIVKHKAHLTFKDESGNNRLDELDNLELNHVFLECNGKNFISNHLVLQSVKAMNINVLDPFCAWKIQVSYEYEKKHPFSCLDINIDEEARTIILQLVKLPDFKRVLTLPDNFKWSNFQPILQVLTSNILDRQVRISKEPQMDKNYNWFVFQIS